MMNKPIFFTIGILLTLIQMFFGNIFNINGVVPNLPIVYLIFLALFYGKDEPIYLAFLLGAIKDLYYYGSLGITTFIYVIIVYIIGYNKHYFFNENLNIAILFISITTILLELYFSLTSMIFINTPYDLTVLNISIRLVYNIVAATIMYYISRLNWKQVIQ